MLDEISSQREEQVDTLDRVGRYAEDGYQMTDIVSAHQQAVVSFNGGDRDERADEQRAD